MIGGKEGKEVRREGVGKVRKDESLLMKVIGMEGRK